MKHRSAATRPRLAMASARNAADLSITSGNFYPKRALARSGGRRGTSSRSQAKPPALATLLIRARQHCLAENMTLHGALEVCLRRTLEIRQCRIERVQLVEIAMTADRWTRSAVAGAVPVVHAFARAGRKFRRLHGLGQPGGGRRNVV